MVKCLFCASENVQDVGAARCSDMEKAPCYRFFCADCKTEFDL